MVHKRCLQWALSMGGVILVLAACSSGRDHPGPSASSSAATGLGGSSTNLLSSTISFTLSGGATGTYTIESAQTTSKLRHGHREFTIFLTQKGTAILLAFYGYNGPGSYTLSNGMNGGELRIDLGTGAGTWDLSLRPTFSCSLLIASDIPTQRQGIDRMQGSFSCPLLPSSDSGRPKKAVAVSNGHFDILILVES